MSDEKKEPLKQSDKAQSKENKEARAAQSKAGKVRLNERKEYEIVKDSKHFNKGDKVKLGAPTYEVFKAKGLVK